MKKSTVVLIVVLVILIIALAGVFVWASLQGKSISKRAAPTVTPATATRTSTAAAITPAKSATATRTATSSPPPSVDEEELDQIITSSSTGMGAPSITGVNVTEKKYYTAEDGTIWLKYIVTPIPENAADPGTGIMKKEPYKDWEGVNFGTAGLAKGLPADVAAALGIMD